MYTKANRCFNTHHISLAVVVDNSYDFFVQSTVHTIISEPAFAAVIVNKRR